jgi:hypothetical protein
VQQECVDSLLLARIPLRRPVLSAFDLTSGTIHYNKSDRVSDNRRSIQVAHYTFAFSQPFMKTKSFSGAIITLANLSPRSRRKNNAAQHAEAATLTGNIRPSG